MQNKREDSVCYNMDCNFNQPFLRPHRHYMTNDGSYVRYVVEKKPQPNYDDNK